MRHACWFFFYLGLNVWEESTLHFLQTESINSIEKKANKETLINLTIIMEYRKLTITIVSADNLPSVRRWGQMRVYAVVSCGRASFSTKVDMDKERHPRWRESFDFLMDEACVQKPGTHVVVRLYRKRKWSRDKPLGDDVAIEVKSLYDRGIRAENSVTYSVPKAGGGTLNILYDFGPVLAPKHDYPICNKIFGCGMAVCCSALPNLI